MSTLLTRTLLQASLDLRDRENAAALGCTLADYREALAQATPEGRLALLQPTPAFATAVTREESERSGFETPVWVQTMTGRRDW